VGCEEEVGRHSQLRAFSFICLTHNAVGLLWNRCLRDLAIVIFYKWAKEGTTRNKAVDSGSCQCLYEAVFEQFNDEDLEKIESTLENQGLETILEDEKESTKHLELEFGQVTPKELPRNSSNFTKSK
jgi:hypothetical protein